MVRVLSQMCAKPSPASSHVRPKLRIERVKKGSALSDVFKMRGHRAQLAGVDPESRLVRIASRRCAEKRKIPGLA